MVSIIFTATIGYANTLSITVNPIGAKDDTIPALNSIEIGQIQWKKAGANYNKVLVEIRNTDTITHTYEICVILCNLFIEVTNGKEIKTKKEKERS